MLTLENIEVIVGEVAPKKVLTQLNLHVASGEFVVILGHNGAGKSTLFNLISGSLRPCGGKIFIDHEEMTGTSPTSRATLVSRVVQDPKVGTLANMTLFENMAFACRRGKPRGLSFFSTQRRRVAFREQLSALKMGLEERLDAQVCSLSGGERQALSVIMALLSESKILLLDEITAALDPANSENLMQLTHSLVRQRQHTCLMITHNLKHALDYGDRVLLLKQGCLSEAYSSAPSPPALASH